MKPFIVKVSSIIITIIMMMSLLTIYLKLRGQANNQSLMGLAIIDKHKHLASLNKPKIILLGGSNVMFGYDSKMLKEAFGMDVQNMGFGASLGVSFLLNEVKTNIKKGDYIVLSTEYYLDYEGNKNFQLYIQDLFPEASKYIVYKNTFDFIRFNWNYRIRKIRNFLLLDLLSKKSKHKDAYDRNSFNQYGDLLDSVRSVQITTPLNDLSSQQQQDYSKEIKVINQFITFAQKRGAMVVYKFPIICESQFKVNKTQYLAFYNQLKQHLHAPLIDTPEDGVFPDSCFYDTVYHLRSPYNHVNTERMIPFLRKQINISQQTSL